MVYKEYECEDCGKGWNNWRHRKQHLDATGHDPKTYPCDDSDCSSELNNQSEWETHVKENDHWGNWRYEYECHCCDNEFIDEDARREHEHDDHLYCADHDQYFQNKNNLNQHLNSKKHAHERPAGPTCPFCKATRNTATGLAHHLERGSCPKAPTNREALFREIRRRDPNGVLSKKLLEYPISEEYSTTDLAYNHHLRAYECYLCHRLFKQLNSLNQHLDSPVHQQNLYHCPKGNCQREFTTLAGLVNHFESESCGYMRFSAVQNNVGRILDTGRMITG